MTTPTEQVVTSGASRIRGETLRSSVTVALIAILLAMDGGFALPDPVIDYVRFAQLGIALLAGFLLSARHGQSVVVWFSGCLALILAILGERFLFRSVPAFPATGPTTIMLWIMLGAVAGWHLYRLLRLLITRTPTPHVMVTISFLGLIMMGTLALLLPTATHGSLRPNISVLDAFFTATSAVCVTGLIVVDTAADFSRVGQVLIMILIQLGGLGIMAYVGIFAISLRRGSSLQDAQRLKDAFNAESFARIKQLLKIMLVVAFGFEIIGAAMLSVGLRDMPVPRQEQLFHAVFQSVSGFCNAGFSTFPDSLVRFSGNAWVVLTVGILIIVGGIGFHVALELAGGLTEILRKQHHGAPWSIHMRLVVWSSALLLVIGFLAVWAGSDWQGFSTTEILLSSFFQSLTTRTAGFNSMPMTVLSTPVLVVFMGLMLIGGSPGGTAGGIKTSTVGLLFYATLNYARGRSSVEIMRRTIPPHLVQMAFVLTGMALTFVASAFTLLCVFEPHMEFRDLLFETISAFGTVGLSLGVTPELSTPSKLVICLVMFCGRIGPLTLFLAFVRKRDEALYAYPAGTIVLG